MRVTIDLEAKPETGNELAIYIQRVVTSVMYNMGPEPIRLCRGPIYNEDKSERVGTWEVRQDTPEPTSSEPELVESVAQAIYETWCVTPWPEAIEGWRNDARKEAKAAIVAYRLAT